ncbi:MAG: hypothetical protein VW803_04755 [Aquiluna sp.]
MPTHPGKQIDTHEQHRHDNAGAKVAPHHRDQHDSRARKQKDPYP